MYRAPIGGAQSVYFNCTTACRSAVGSLSRNGSDSGFARQAGAIAVHRTRRNACQIYFQASARKMRILLWETSAIVEPVGLGGFGDGGRASRGLGTSERRAFAAADLHGSMGEITVGAHPAWAIPAMDFVGSD